MRFVFVGCLISFVSLVSPAFAGLTWETTYREIRVPAGEKEVLADYGFKNTGPERVDITSIQTSCGCTSAKVDSKQIAPGESGAVHVKFDVGGRKGEQVKGVVVKTSDRAKHSLVLRALIQEPVSFSQKDFAWSSGSSPMPKESIIELAPGTMVVGVESMNDQFEARLEDMGGGRRYRLVVTPRSTGILVDTSIKVQVADPKKRSVLLHARVEE